MLLPEIFPFLKLISVGEQSTQEKKEAGKQTSEDDKELMGIGVSQISHKPKID